MNRTVTVAGALIVLFVLLVPAIGPPASAPAARAPDAAGPVATGVRSSSPPSSPWAPPSSGGRSNRGRSAR